MPTKIGIYENELYPDIADALSTLKSSGHRMFVATSKPKAFADRIIEHFGLSPYFEAVYGSELDGTRSEKSELLAWVVAQERLSPAKTVMVGDRSHDITVSGPGRARQLCPGTSDLDFLGALNGGSSCRARKFPVRHAQSRTAARHPPYSSHA
jgi:hypothetical protein